MSVCIVLSRHAAHGVVVTSRAIRPTLLGVDDWKVVASQARTPPLRTGSNGRRAWMTTKPDYQNTEILYEGPMASLITSLKAFSLTSTALSTVGLPAIMTYRGFDLYSSVHAMMVFTTMAGSIGSTLGLQYIFAPYVYRLEMIPIRKCSNPQKEEEHKTTVNTESSLNIACSTSTPPQPGSFLLKATTRSILLTPVEHVFDPETDVKGVPGGTIRPFCSFFAKGKPLYIHEQMINDPKLSHNLFVNNHNTKIQKPKNPDPDDEFL